MEGYSATQKHADPEYGKYEGTETSSARHPYETAYEQEVREGPSGKVYPLQHSNTNTLRFALAVIALGLVVLFGLLFIVVIGGTIGWPSFTVACIAVLLIAGVGIDKIR
jgi:hypothetical protein